MKIYQQDKYKTVFAYELKSVLLSLNQALSLNLSLMFIAPSSLIRYFITYGIATKLQSLPPQPEHTVEILLTSWTKSPEIFSIFLNADNIEPHLLQTYPSDRSELLKRRSLTT